MGIRQKEGQRRKNNKEQGLTCCKRLWAVSQMRLSRNTFTRHPNGIDLCDLGYHCSQTIKDPTNGCERSLPKQDPERNHINMPIQWLQEWNQ